jgi:hypothetical protein
MHFATAGRDQGLVTFQHGRNLFALIRVDQQNDLVVTHECSLWIPAAGAYLRPTWVEAAPMRQHDGCGKES